MVLVVERAARHEDRENIGILFLTHADTKRV
jgi:hypothetical protein